MTNPFNVEKTAQKFQQLAKDALTSGDPVAYENYLQHAEHYNRRLAELNVKPKEPKIEPKVVSKENVKKPTSLKPSQTSVKPLKTEPNVKKEEVLTDPSEMPNFITQSFKERQK